MIGARVHRGDRMEGTRHDSSMIREKGCDEGDSTVFDGKVTVKDDSIKGAV